MVLRVLSLHVVNATLRQYSARPSFAYGCLASLFWRANCLAASCSSRCFEVCLAVGRLRRFGTLLRVCPLRGNVGQCKHQQVRPLIVDVRSPLAGTANNLNRYFRVCLTCVLSDRTSDGGQLRQP